MDTLYRNAIELRNNGFTILPMVDLRPLKEIQAVVSDLSTSSSAIFNSSRDSFHKLIETYQNMINDANLLQEFIKSNDQLIQFLVGDDDLSFVSVLKLRAVRPKTLLPPPAQDHVPVHRESLYANTDQVTFQYNCWIPVSEAATSSGMYYYPRSHIIDDTDLEISEDPGHSVRVDRYSAGHRIGLPYLPKLISTRCLDGIGAPSRFNVPIGSFVVFSAMLLHGGGENNSNELRLSVDTGCIPSRRLKENDQLFAADGRPHYMSPSELGCYRSNVTTIRS